MADQWREITAEWQGGGTFVGHNAAGGTVQMGKLDESTGCFTDGTNFSRISRVYRS